MGVYCMLSGLYTAPTQLLNRGELNWKFISNVLTERMPSDVHREKRSFSLHITCRNLMKTLTIRVPQQTCSESFSSSWLPSEKFCKRVSWRSWKASWVLHIYLDYEGLFICFVYLTFCVLLLNLFALASETLDLAAALIYSTWNWAAEGGGNCSTELHSGLLKHLNTVLSVRWAKKFTWAGAIPAAQANMLLRICTLEQQGTWTTREDRVF